MTKDKNKKTRPNDYSVGQVIEILKKGGVGVMPTDTLYGLVGGAFSRKAVKRIYKIKKRDKKKKFIVLISSFKDLKKFNIKIDKNLEIFLKRYWPGKTSIILNDIAFRLPKKKSLIEIIKKTGPLVAPSANREGNKPAENIKQAKKYFKDEVDFYVSDGAIKGKPSNLIRINSKREIEVLRGTIKK